MLQEGGTDIDYEVYVLEGGFASFQKLFKVSGFIDCYSVLFLASTVRSSRMTPNWSKTGTNEDGIGFHRL